MRSTEVDNEVSPSSSQVPAWDASTRVARENRNVFNFLIPHGTNERASARQGTPQQGESRKIRSARQELCQLLEAAVQDPQLADDLYWLLDAATRQAKQTRAEHLKSSRRAATSSPKKNVGCTSPSEGLSSGQMRARQGLNRRLNRECSDTNSTFVHSWANDEEDMDFNQDPAKFFGMVDSVPAPLDADFDAEEDADADADRADGARTPPQRGSSGHKLKLEARTPPAPLTRLVDDAQRRAASEPSMTPQRVHDVVSCLPTDRERDTTQPYTSYEATPPMHPAPATPSPETPPTSALAAQNAPPWEEVKAILTDTAEALAGEESVEVEKEKEQEKEKEPAQRKPKRKKEDQWTTVKTKAEKLAEQQQRRDKREGRTQPTTAPPKPAPKPQKQRKESRLPTPPPSPSSSSSSSSSSSDESTTAMSPPTEDGPPDLESELGEDDADEDDNRVKGLSDVILATMSPEKSEGGLDSTPRKKPWVAVPRTEAEDAQEEKKNKIRERHERAEQNLHLIRKEQNYKHATHEERISTAKNRVDAESEKRRRDVDQRHDAATARAMQATREKEERARAANERVGATVFLRSQQRAEKARDLQQKEVKKAAKDGKKMMSERDKAQSQSEKTQAVIERRKGLEEEREKLLQDKIKKREEQMMRAEEVKRQEAAQREKRSEEHAKKVAVQREANTERDETATRKIQDKMTNSAANRVKELERIKSKAEQSHKVNTERKASPLTPLMADVIKELMAEEKGNRKKRMSRIALTMEKLSQEYLTKEAKEENVDVSKSRSVKAINRLKPILVSGRLAQSKGIVSELVTLLITDSKGRQPAAVQEIACFRVSGGMELLTKLLVDDSKQSEDVHIAAPIGHLLQGLMGTPQCVEHFVRSGCLLGMMDVMANVTEETIPVHQSLFSICCRCLQFARTDACVADVRNALFSYADACGIGKIAYASIVTLDTQYAEFVYTCVQLLTGIALATPSTSDAWTTTLLEGSFNLLSNLLLPLSMQTAKARSVTTVQSAYESMEDGTVVALPPTEVLSISLATLQLLNVLSRQNIALMQKTVKTLAVEFLHIAVLLIQVACQHSEHLGDDVSLTIDSLPASADSPHNVMMRPLLHELLLYMGYIAMGCGANQELFRWGKQPLLCLLCNLPVQYFSTAAYKKVLFPTLVLLSFGAGSQNRSVLQQEVSLTSVVEFIEGEIASRPDLAKSRGSADTTPTKGGDAGGDGGADTVLDPPGVMMKKNLGAKPNRLAFSAFYEFAKRFPPSLWSRAEAFYMD